MVYGASHVNVRVQGDRGFFQLHTTNYIELL